MDSRTINKFLAGCTAGSILLVASALPEFDVLSSRRGWEFFEQAYHEPLPPEFPTRMLMDSAEVFLTSSLTVIYSQIQPPSETELLYESVKDFADVSS